jgi:hypothetical protein
MDDLIPGNVFNDDTAMMGNWGNVLSKTKLHSPPQSFKTRNEYSGTSRSQRSATEFGRLRSAPAALRVPQQKFHGNELQIGCYRSFYPTHSSAFKRSQISPPSAAKLLPLDYFDSGGCRRTPCSKNPRPSRVQPGTHPHYAQSASSRIRASPTPVAPLARAAMAKYPRASPPPASATLARASTSSQRRPIACARIPRSVWHAPSGRARR